MTNCNKCEHTYEPKEKPKAKTAGEKWAQGECPLIDHGMPRCAGNSLENCEWCRVHLAKAYDLGRASAKPEPAEPAEESEFRKAYRGALLKTYPTSYHNAMEAEWSQLTEGNSRLLKACRYSFNTALGLVERDITSKPQITWLQAYNRISALKAPEKG